MRKIKEVLRLKFEAALTHERISGATGMSKGAVTKYLQRAAEAGIGWPLAPEMDDGALQALLFPAAPAPVTIYVVPDFALIHQELERHYCAQLRRYYIANHISQRDLDPAPAPTDPPF